MKVAIYCRVSTDDKGQDPKVQLMKCKAYCESYGHEIISVHMDEGVSGDTWYFDRPEGKKLCKLIDDNKIEAIVVFSVDRFSRQNPMKILPLLNNLNQKGVKFISTTEPIFNMESDTAEPMRYFLTWFSNYFLKQHVIKVNAGLDKARKYGTKSGKPIGKQRTADYGKIVELSKSGMSISAIARQLSYSKASVKRAIDLDKGLTKPVQTWSY